MLALTWTLLTNKTQHTYEMFAALCSTFAAKFTDVVCRRTFLQVGGLHAHYKDTKQYPELRDWMHKLSSDYAGMQDDDLALVSSLRPVVA